MSNRILLLTECGSETGFGHLTRCASLAQAFRETGFDAVLWVAADETLRSQLPPGAWAIDWYDLPGPAAAEMQTAYAVIVDSYRVTSPQIEQIAQIKPRFAILDDWVRRAHRHGIVIDWTIGAERFAYPHKHPDVSYLLGRSYCALRPEFNAPPRRVISETPRAVLITFGGSDIRQLTTPVLAMLNSEFPSLHKHVVVGAGVRDKRLIDKMRGPHTTVHVACDAAQMCAAMAQADLAVCAGGQTLYELASQGLPPAVIGVIDNQRDDIREFAAGGFAVEVGDWTMTDLLPSVAAAVQALWPVSERRQRASIGRQFVDGCGAQRLTTSCLEHWSHFHAHD
jgi:UDP-2,4-diacetamido-2,4,6-trideoxy-beta-L-altropyranose hydrolase